ncbi:MAG: His-Xaa-Ser system radical SAM maturase HxsB [Sorangiineae bacterium]|nr:His-Xaa-Ser system radical SAM maturase HxsB [Polyangiaceae bacterium]MEB2321640.1 His-Xaa-Ser system radical SAM maturase HxsB [Sorangiineae bacterium]
MQALSLVDPSAQAKSPGRLVPFRYREVGGRVLLTSYFGDWVFVTRDEFRELYQGRIPPGVELKLGERNFLADRLDVAKTRERVAHRRRFLNWGPILHVLVVTLRCNETCVYCHASRADMDRVDTDMSKETAEKAIDIILKSTSPRITIEFQGGEPLANFPLIKHSIEYVNEKNRAYGKEIEFTMVSNLALMDDEKLDYLVENKVQICTSIDGPERLHNKQRVLPSGNAYQEAARWVKLINQRYVDMGLDPVLYHVEALLTTTRASLDYPKEIVDTYVELGCRSIFLRPVDPFGFADKTHEKIEYDRARYMDFYRTATDYIIELNVKGTQVLERFASIFLTKILTGDDPNFLDIRNPGGAGVGCLCFNYDGTVYTSDEGRMLREMGDDMFAIGHVDTSKYRELVTHETVRAALIASNLDAQPDCVNCTYNPYCGNKPEHNFKTQGSIFGRMRENHICAVHKGIQDYVFEKLAAAEPETMEIFRRWTTVRERTHFLQVTSAS